MPEATALSLRASLAMVLPALILLSQQLLESVWSEVEVGAS